MHTPSGAVSARGLLRRRAQFLGPLAAVDVLVVVGPWIEERRAVWLRVQCAFGNDVAVTECTNSRIKSRNWISIT